MPQSSGPITNRNFTDALWRDIFGDEAGVLGDLDGSAYKLTLPTDSDVVSVGSTTQDSLARVAGFGHRISKGSTESITIPAAGSASRTDIIALRYDPANTGDPGPVRLHRIAGTSAAIPTYDAAPPGVEDLPLFAITRSPGQSLSQALTARLFPRLAPVLGFPVGASLPLSSPLDTVVLQGPLTYRRELGTAVTPVWNRISTTEPEMIYGAHATGASGLLLAGGTRDARSILIPAHARGKLHIRCSTVWTAPANAAATFRLRAPDELPGSLVRSLNAGKADTPVTAVMDAWVTTTGAARTVTMAVGVEANSAAITARETSFSVWLH